MADSVDAVELIRTALAERISDRDGVARLADDEPLAALGIDSLTLISVVADLQRRHALLIDDDIVFDAGVSIATLAAAMPAVHRASAPIVAGIGVVGPTGRGADALWTGLLDQQSHHIPAPYQTHRRHQVGAVPPAGEAEIAAPGRLLDLLIAAAEEALDDAGVRDRSTVRLVVGTTSVGGNALGLALDTGTPSPSALAGTTASQAASALGLHDDAVTISSASAAGAVAVGYARDLIVAGEAAQVLIVGVDAVSETAFQGLTALRTLSPDGCRPFSRYRKGIAVSEAAAALLLQGGGSTAVQASRHGRLAGYGASGHTTHLAAPEADGIALAVRRALCDAAIGPSDIAFVNAHGPGTVLGDIAEITALREVFGDALSGVAINSSKGVLGHCQGAAGIIESVVCLLSLRHRVLTPTTGCEPVDERWSDLDIVTVARPLSSEASHSMSVSCGLGGINTALIWSGPA